MNEEIVSILPQITLKEAVQRRLASDLAADGSLQARLEADPGAVLKPIIAELIGDDGDIDLSKVKTTVHFESDTDLHFVVTPGASQADLDEVSGFSMPGVSSMMTGMTIGFDDLGGATGIKYDDNTRRLCSTNSPGQTTHRNCSTKARLCS